MHVGLALVVASDSADDALSVPVPVGATPMTSASVGPESGGHGVVELVSAEMGRENDTGK